MKKLVVFGCSWAYGSELVDPALDYKDKDGYHGSGSDFDHSNDQYRLDHCFGNLVAKNYGVELDLKAEPGNSNFGILCNFHRWLDTSPSSDTLAVFSMTDSNRHSWLYKEKMCHSSWIQWERKHELFETYKQWVVHLNTLEWQQQNENTITRSIIDSCENRKISFIICDSLPRTNSVKHQNYLWPGHTLQQELINFDKTCFASGGHPNESGHARIAEILVDFIDNRQIIK